MFEVIDAYRAMLDRERNRLGRAKLVGMNFASETEPTRDFEIPCEKLPAFGAGLPGKVGKSSETAPANLGQEFPEYPFAPAAGIFTGVIGFRQAEEKRGDDFERVALERSQHAEQLGLSADVRAA